MVGIALGLRQLVQQGLGSSAARSPTASALPMIVSGMLLRAAGFAAMAVAHEPGSLVLLSALGHRRHAVRSAAHRAGSEADPPGGARPLLSLLMMQDSAGAVLGALIGSWLLARDFRLVCWAARWCSCWPRCSTPCCCPRRISTVPTPMREGLSRVLKDRRFCTYVLTLTGYYMLAVQVMLMLPIMVNQVAGSASAVKWMYAIEATLSLTLLYPIARWAKALSPAPSPDGGPAVDDAQPAAHRPDRLVAAAVCADQPVLYRLDYRRAARKPSAPSWPARGARQLSRLQPPRLWRWAAHSATPAAAGCSTPPRAGSAGASG